MQRDAPRAVSQRSSAPDGRGSGVTSGLYVNGNPSKAIRPATDRMTRRHREGPTGSNDEKSTSHDLISCTDVSCSTDIASPSKRRFLRMREVRFQETE